MVLLIVTVLKSNSKLTRLAQSQISLLLLYPLMYLGLISFASTKLPHYAIPTYPFLALLTGYAVDRLGQAIPHAGVTRLLDLSNGLLIFLGSVLIVGFGLAMTTEVLPNTTELRPYIPIALGLGLGWLGAGLLWFRAPQKRDVALSWFALLLLGHWLSLTIAWGTADLGNVNPEMKALLIREDIQPILQRERVDFSPGLNSKRSTLLRFYTPNPGAMLKTLERVGSDDYLWIEDNELPRLQQTYNSLGHIKQTHLIRIQP